jgi:MFS family permease
MLMGWILGLSPSFLHEQLGVQVTQPVVAGLFAAAVFATNGATQLTMRRHHGKVAALRVGMGLIVLGLAGFAASAHTGGLPLAVVGGMIAGVGGGLVQPNTMATIQRIAPDHARGGVTSALLAVSYVAMSLPVVTAGLAAGAAHVGLGTIATGYLAAMALLVTVAVVASRRSDLTRTQDDLDDGRFAGDPSTSLSRRGEDHGRDRRPAIGVVRCEGDGDSLEAVVV